MPWPNCDVCGKPAKGVCSSGAGPISYAYCEECLITGREPYGAWIGGLMGCPSEGLLKREDIRQDLLPSIDASLEFAGKTWDDLAADVDKAMKEYEEYCNANPMQPWDNDIP